MAEVLSLRDQAVLTANALRGMADEMEDGKRDVPQRFISSLREHAEDLMKSAFLALSAEVASQQPCSTQDGIHPWGVWAKLWGGANQERACAICGLTQRISTYQQEQGERLRPAAGKDESNSI